MIKYLNISCDSIKVLEENRDRKFSDSPHSNIFTGMSPRAREIKERINKWDYIKLKSFFLDPTSLGLSEHPGLAGLVPLLDWESFPYFLICLNKLSMSCSFSSPSGTPMKGKDLHQRLLYQAKLSFREEG